MNFQIFISTLTGFVIAAFWATVTDAIQCYEGKLTLTNATDLSAQLGRCEGYRCVFWSDIIGSKGEFLCAKVGDTFYNVTVANGTSASSSCILVFDNVLLKICDTTLCNTQCGKSSATPSLPALFRILYSVTNTSNFVTPFMF